MLDTIEAKIFLLANNPGLGKSRPEIAADVRSFPVGNYLLLYRQIPGGVEIVRVIHGRRDLTKLKLQ